MSNGVCPSWGEKQPLNIDALLLTSCFYFWPAGLLFSQNLWYFRRKPLWLTDNDICICRTEGRRITPYLSPVPRASLFNCLYFFIPSYLLKIERYMPSKPFRGFPLSSKIFFILNRFSCLIFLSSLWPFYRTNKVLKMQVLSSCERQLGHSPLLLLFLFFCGAHAAVSVLLTSSERLSDTKASGKWLMLFIFYWILFNISSENLLNKNTTVVRLFKCIY